MVFGFVLMVAVVVVVVLGGLGVVACRVFWGVGNTWANVAVKVWVAAVEIERAVGGQVGR